MSSQPSRRTAVLATALALLCVPLAACGSSTKGGASSSKPLVGVDYPRADTDFWNSYIKYVPQFAGQQGVTLKTTNSQNDISKLASNVQTLISQQVKGVVIAPQDTAAVKPTLQTLAAKKIPVVSIDTRPDSGKVFMIVRADNKAYGEKACRFLGTKLKGKGRVVDLEGDLTSINGRDRTDAFNACMKQNYPGITVVGEPTNWDQDTASRKLKTDLQGAPVNGVYMQASFALSGTLQALKQRGMLVPPSNPKHVYIVSNDGIPQELKDIKAGQIDATVSQPADQYAKYGLFYIKAAIDGKTFKPGKTDHGSTIIRTPQGNLEDQLPAPLVTLDGGSYGGITSVKPDDTSLWGNHLGG
ncbi:ABC transporter substrate-binding protein [Mangrovactinospora gilvigrisea]|uniref:ABC transporter substrate-binding protein n=1 Tax=Mangrovactinospora gilvigrisea TaxID=1428644 RepID=A0A1J7C2M1_9ACTN|nr:sugar ABC transporter substrate-binding protein [Mangrovactinospora gilvigrisea]OIV35808.1 ABC transporter substrate-binding protein [Mangrovactinospora gilvigrisea]